MRIVVDAMGGDFGPGPAVEGAVRAARRYGVTMLLVGRSSDIEYRLSELDIEGLPLEIIHAPQVVGMDERSPASAVRKSPDSSISRGMSLVRSGDADALVTTGHTGVALAGAMFRLGRSRGVRRPALATPFPTTNGACTLIDIGANADVRPRFLLQFALMGAVHAERILGIANPRVGLVSIGEERGKGNQVVQAALPLLEGSDLNFVGNVEGRDIPLGNVDVAVMDGFTGNVLMKFAEGAAALVHQLLREAARSDPVAVLGGILMRGALRRAEIRMDYRAYGGAVLLGARGMVVIGHGRSDAEAVETAVSVAMRGVESGLVGAIAQRIEVSQEQAASGAGLDASESPGLAESEDYEEADR